MRLSKQEIFDRLIELEIKVQYLTNLMGMQLGEISEVDKKRAVQRAIETIKKKYPDLEGGFEVEFIGKDGNSTPTSIGTLRVIKT
jgi:hypothetical protein